MCLSEYFTYCAKTFRPGSDLPIEIIVSGYNTRALVEADISRFKRVIGGALRARTDRRRATEVSVAVGVLNRMLELGRPEYARIT